MSVIRWTALMSLYVLGACDSGAGADATSTVGERSDNAMSDAQITSAMNDLVKPQPGQYRTQVEVLEIAMPNLPESARDTMQQLAQKTQLSCLTPAQADKGYEEILKRSQSGNCDFERFSATGGKIDARMICKSEQGGSMAMTITGTGLPTSSDVIMTMTSQILQVGDLAMKVRVLSERIGDCPA